MTILMIECGGMIGNKVKSLNGGTTLPLEWTLVLIQLCGVVTGIVDKMVKRSLDKLMFLFLALVNKMSTLVDRLLGQELITIDPVGMNGTIEIPQAVDNPLEGRRLGLHAMIMAGL